MPVQVRSRVNRGRSRRMVGAWAAGIIAASSTLVAFGVVIPGAAKATPDTPSGGFALIWRAVTSLDKGISASVRTATVSATAGAGTLATAGATGSGSRRAPTAGAPPGTTTSTSTTSTTTTTATTGAGAPARGAGGGVGGGGGAGGGGGGGAPTTSTTPATTTTSTTTAPTTTTTPSTTTTTTPATTTTTTTTPSTSNPSGVILAGNSKTTCVYTGSSGWAAALTAVDQLTGINYNCIETFSNADPTWNDWIAPWVTNSFGFSQWLAADPTNRTIILTQQLIPDSVCTSVCANPLAWETTCDSGAYNTYATQLATELVSTGFGSSTIRLGAEMNGSWENDYAGSTVQEQQAWAHCYAQEVGAMRAVAGAHFLFDWNVNACVDTDVLSNLYPGSSSVDIIGIDAYDAFCSSPTPSAGSTATFDRLIAEPDGLTAVTSFAQQMGKPMSLPEWAPVDAANAGVGDDGYYVSGIGSYVHTNDVAFQSYFDTGAQGTLPLGTQYPASLAAYKAAFG